MYEQPLPRSEFSISCPGGTGCRRRKYPRASFLVASALVVTASAFQTSLPHTSRDTVVTTRRFPTAQRVLTEPDTILRMDPVEGRRPDLGSLEDVYILSTDYDRLPGDNMVSARRVVKPRRKPPKKISLSTMSNKQVGKGPSKSRQAAKFDEFEQQLSVVPNVSPKASIAREHTAAKEGRSTTSRGNRSSTMPGFVERGMSGRQRAFDDGIKMAEQRSGKQISKIVDTPEARKQRRKVNGEAMYKTSASVPESMIQFAHEIHDVARITPSEELKLGEKTQEAIRLQKMYDALEKTLQRAPTDQEWCAAAGKINMEAIRQTIEEGVEAKNMLVTSNLRMVQGVVNLYIRNGLGGQYNAGDLMQEGIVALIRAAEKFDPSRGFRFSTYAMYWIRSAIKRQQIFQSRVITVPQRLYENHKRILRVEKDLKETLGRDPTKAEIGEVVGMSELQIDRCSAAMAQRCYSLDQHITNTKKPMNGDTEKETMYELVSSRVDDSDYNSLERLFLREDLVETLYRHLSEEEATLLMLRYGLMDSPTQSLKSGGPLTIAEVSRLAGLKPDKVRRMINRSLDHLNAIIGDEWRGYEQDLLQL